MGKIMQGINKKKYKRENPFLKINVITTKINICKNKLSIFKIN